jgi:hypothetical protein
LTEDLADAFSWDTDVLAFFHRLLDMTINKIERSKVVSHVGSSFVKKLPITAPTMVAGSMMRMRSQSMRGRSANGCCLQVSPLNTLA